MDGLKEKIMKKFAKIIALFMAMLMLVSLCACNDTESEELNIPERIDYSQSGKEFDYYTYKSLNAGYYNLFGRDFFVGESFVNEEYIKEYFESGMKWLCPQVVATGKGPNDFKDSPIQKVLDTCHDLGYDKSVVLTDNVIYEPYHQAQNEIENGAWADETDWSKITCIGTEFDWQWESEAELDAYFEERMSAYAHHPAFQGVYMPDEPGARYMKIIGETYRSLRRVQKKLGLEEMFININMLPYFTQLVSSSYPVVEKDFHVNEEQRQHEAYRRYIKSYFEETQAEYIQADLYPMLEDGMYRLYLINVQLMAEVAKEYGAKIIILNQTHSNVGQVMTSYESLNYQNNIAYGFGAVNNAYYSYFTLDDGYGAGDASFIHRDDGSMMSRFGDKTPVYDIVKELNQKGQVLAPYILNFDYQTHALYSGKELNTFCEAYDYAELFSSYQDFAEFKKLTNYSVNKEYSVVSELYDEEKDNYMYMAMNVTDPIYTSRGSAVYQTATLTFASEYNKALVFTNGKWKTYNLDETNTLTVKMRPGEAHYIIPYAE